MKNALHLFIACIITTVTFAQAQIDKDFQGYWKLNEISVGGVRINVAKSTITFSKERESKMSADEKTKLEAKKQDVLQSISNSHITVAANEIDFVIGDMGKKGVYVLEKYSDAYKLAVAYEDGSADNMIIYIKDKKLYITKSDDIDRDEMIFIHN